MLSLNSTGNEGLKRLLSAAGHWRVFDADLSLQKFYDDSHLVVMRELKEEANSPKTGKEANRPKTGKETNRPKTGKEANRPKTGKEATRPHNG